MEEKEQNKIPTSKVKRAAKIVGTGAKVGGNYIKYYSKRMLNSSLSKEALHTDNAEDIYNTLSELKGSALKVAQMMSMDDQVLPKAYQDKFALSQYSAPALSYPLIAKTFKNFLGKSPEEIFDTFTKKAVNAASIGQVHKATLGDKKLAVKIQYPGVADSISSDLKLVKPLAAKLLNMKSADLNLYLEEVETKLLEETDYKLEIKQSKKIAGLCAHLEGVKFPSYYDEYSADRILTMDWIDGDLFTEYIKKEKSQEKKNEVGQRLWDFFLYQMKELSIVHADPHPGNFIINDNNDLVVLDFGCVKEIPNKFAENYFQLLSPTIQDDPIKLNEIYENINFFRPEDKPHEKDKLREVYQSMLSLLALPFHDDDFDFSDDKYFKQIATLGDEFTKDKTLKKINSARGSRDAIYIMRTFFGLYNLLHQLKANVKLNYVLYDWKAPLSVRSTKAS